MACPSCCGCAQLFACTNCRGKAPDAYYGSASGITASPSGTCFASSGQALTITYTSTQDFALCMTQPNATYSCEWGGPIAIADDFYLGTFGNQHTGTSCPATGLSGDWFTVPLLDLSPTAWTCTILQWNPIQNPTAVIFYDTIPISSAPNCTDTKISLNFTNTVTPGSLYPIPANYNRGQAGIGFASGGSFTVTFKKSCCL